MMDENQSKVLQQAFFPIAILSASITILAVGVVADIVTAIKGSYTLFGLLIAASLYYSSREGSPLSVPIQPTYLKKFTTILVLIAIPLTLVVDSRLPTLLFIIPLGYLCIWFQIDSTSPTSVVTQLTGLYLLSPVTKVLTSGLYFENGDVFDHIRYVTVLLSTGRIETIPRYSDYPVYHLLTGTVSTVTGFLPYHAMVVAQLVLFATLPFMLYFISLYIFGDYNLALLTVFTLTAIYTVSRFVTVYFPQSIAVILVVYFLYLSFKLEKSSNSRPWRMFIVIGLVGFVTIITHHLTILIFIPFIGVILLGRLYLSYFEHRSPIGPSPSLLLAFMIGAVGNWVYERDFLLEFLYHTTQVFQPSASGGEEWRTVIALGQALPVLNERIALRSLVSAEGIYFALLVSVVTIGTIQILSSFNKYRRAIHFIAAGMLTIPLILRTPIAPDLPRLRFPLAVFFVFVIGPGLERLWKAEFDMRIFRVVPAVLVIVLATTGVLVASHDLYAFNEGPDLYELRPLPEPEVDYSKSELQELRETGRFVNEYDNNNRVSTFSMTGRALRVYGISYEDAVANQTRIRTTDELFVYRTSWTTHRVSFTRHHELGTVTISDNWLDQTIGTENRIYTTGDTGILWSSDEEPSYKPRSSLSANKAADYRQNSRPQTPVH